MPTLHLPTDEQLRPFLGGLTGALAGDGGPTDLQLELVRECYQQLHGAPIDDALLAPLPAEEVRAALSDADLLEQLATFVLVLEMVLHPLPDAMVHHAQRYLAELGVAPMLRDVVRQTSHHHLALLHADFLRHSWTTHQTLEGIFGGHLVELTRNKMAYLGVGSEPALARRWRHLGDNPEGSWGRAVFEFYGEHGFPFPGEPHGIYEVGAIHDWIHVLADYDTSPAGEIAVFSFIAASMEDPRGVTQLMFTLSLFQNATINRVFGKAVPSSRGDTLSDAGVVPEVVEAMLRGSACAVDVMDGIDHFALAGEPLDGLRERFAIAPRRTTRPHTEDTT